MLYFLRFCQFGSWKPSTLSLRARQGTDVIRCNMGKTSIPGYASYVFYRLVHAAFNPQYIPYALINPEVASTTRLRFHLQTQLICPKQVTNRIRMSAPPMIWSFAGAKWISAITVTCIVKNGKNHVKDSASPCFSNFSREVEASTSKSVKLLR